MSALGRWGLALLPLLAVAATAAATGGRADSASMLSVDYWRDPGSMDRSRGLQELAASLNARERALVRREEAFSQRESALRESEQRLDERLGELQGVRTEIEALLDGADTEQQDRVVSLVKAVETMRAKQAAAMLSQTEPELAVQVLDRMSRMKAGRALAAMNPIISARLAERMTQPVELGQP